MKHRDDVSFRVFECSTEKRYSNAFEDGFNLFYQGHNGCKKSKKLEKLHNIGSEQKLLAVLSQRRLHTAE